MRTKQRSEPWIKQRSDRDLGTVHALNYFACPRAATPKSRESMATPPQRSRGKILITKFPKFLEETKKGKEESGKGKKVEETGGREEDPSKQEENRQ